VSKTAAVVLAFASFLLFTATSGAQILPRGNVYVGAVYASSEDVTLRHDFRGWNGSVEDMPFPRFSYLGLVLDGTGLYRPGDTQYNLFLGPRISTHYGKWRPFMQAMAGVQQVPVNGIKYHPLAEDVGGGVDYRLFFKKFSWRLQVDYMHTHFLSAHQNDIRASTGLVWRF
jgi:hypothetical protein